jgi:hypothetical protein
MKHKNHDPADATIVMPRKRLISLRPGSARKAALILTGILLLALIGYGGYWLYQSVTTRGTGVVCKRATLEQAGAVLDRSKVEELRPIADNIQKLRRFETDANCLYVVTTYYIYVGDPANSRLYLEKLKSIYDPQKGFSPKLGERVKTIEELEFEVQFVEKADQEFRKSIQTVPNMEGEQ